MAYQTFAGIKYPVSVSTIDEFRKFGEEGMEKLCNLLDMGSFFATIVTQKDIDKALSSDMSEEMKEEIRQTKLGGSIWMIQEVADRIPAEHLHAILLHEEGHLVLRHLEGTQQTTCNINGVNVVTDLTIEFEADQYAVKHTSPFIVQEAMKSLFKALGEVIAIIVEGFDVDDYYKNMINHPVMQERLNAIMN